MKSHGYRAAPDELRLSNDSYGFSPIIEFEKIIG